MTQEDLASYGREVLDDRLRRRPTSLTHALGRQQIAAATSHSIYP